MIFPPPHVTVDKGHGRIEKRKIQVVDVKEGQTNFPYAAQFIKVSRSTTDLYGNNLKKDVAFLVTSLIPEKADAEFLLESIRGHWSIENCLHWVRDVTLGVGILLSLFLLMFITKPLFYARGNEIKNVVNLSVPLTQPGVFVSGSGGKVGYWGRINAEGNLKRCIGGSRSWDAGKITGTVNLWEANLFDYEWLADSQTNYIFKLPQSNINQVSEKNVRLLWEGLERLPSGTAAEMAFSLDSYYYLKEIPKLPGEHLVISWYALDTGEQLITDQEIYYPPSPLGINPHEYWKHIPEQPKKKEPFSSRLSNWLRGFNSYVSSQPPFPDGYLEKVAWLAERPKLF